MHQRQPTSALPGSCGLSKVLGTRGCISRTDLWHEQRARRASELPLPAIRRPPHQIHQPWHWYPPCSTPHLILILPLTRIFRIFPNPIPGVSLRGFPPSSLSRAPSLGLDDDPPSPFRLLRPSIPTLAPGRRTRSLYHPPLRTPVRSSRSGTQHQHSLCTPGGPSPSSASRFRFGTPHYGANETLLPHTRNRSTQLGAARHSFILGYHLTLLNPGKAGRSALIKGGTAVIGAVSVSACCDVSECRTIPIAYLFPLRLLLDTVRFERCGLCCHRSRRSIRYAARLTLASKRSDVL